MQHLLASAGAAVAAWFAVYFIGKPVVALQDRRLEALQTAERYYAVDIRASEEVRDAAEKALFEAGLSLRTLQRGWSTAVRLWCWVWGYDLDLAAQALFGLAEGPRGKIAIAPEIRKNTLDALYVALGAHKHLSAEAVQAIRRMIAQTQAAARETSSASGPAS
ncbi:conserved hypothetical protein [Rhodopseudomonas palustris HaA2]|uniref:Uncharacterized protein n=1 Tax=Rhodopseudomonas palustris (strain HaA2) TaxID=316058 RepID=Q2IUG8_RHOP2|nr:hypothetical protein [Rhodopseudomonas palustris]ABD08142.1 conserved hypothetical protein [Rhodopseudomonas palustris HaA2]